MKGYGVVLGLLAGSLLLWWSAPAPALAQRGHALAFSFGGEGKGVGQFGAGGPDGVAVDDLGDLLYVVDPGAGRIQEFSCTASSCGYVSAVKVKSPGAIAVDNSTGPSAGDVYVVKDATGEAPLIEKLNALDEPVLELKDSAKKERFKGIDGLAVGSDGDLWVYEKTGRIDRFSGAKANEFLESVSSGAEHRASAAPGLAVGPEGSLYVAHEGESGAPVIAKLESSGKPVPGLESFGGKTAVAVAVNTSSDPERRSDVYIDTGTAVSALAPNGSPIQEFGSLTEGRGIAVDSEYGNVYVADSATHRVDVFTLEPPPTTPFPGEPALPDGRAWELVSPPDEHGGAIEPITHEGGAIQASADGNSIAYVADAPIEAEPEGARDPEPAQILSTRVQGAWRSRDIVPPSSRQTGVDDGAPVEYQLFSSDLSVGLVQPFGSETPLAEPPLSPPASPVEEQRKQEEELKGEALDYQEKTIYLRDDAPISPTPVSPKASAGEKKLSEEQEAIYSQAQKNGVTMDNPGYLPLVTALDDTAGDPFGEKLTFLDGTPDLTHVLLSSTVALTQSKSKIASSSYLYEWAGEQLRDVSVLPGTAENPAAAPSLGSSSTPALAPETRNQRNAISGDGSRVFWTENTTHHLYMRDTETGETVMLDKAQGVAEPAEAEAVFQTASADGSKVFFADRYRLTEAAKPSDATATEGGYADLYEFDVNSGTLTDLTPDSSPGEYASVQGLALGSSEDGSYVYFVADGVLADGAAPGDCETGVVGEKPLVPGETCNLYLSHDGTIKFIAALSGEDEPDWKEADQGGLGHVTSRVSPSGRYVAFMSDRPLTGYDNRDAGSGQPDEEVYLYDANSERLLCASCDPTGARPTGVLDTQESGEGLGLLVDRPHTWSTEVKGVDHWLAASIPGWVTTSINGAVYEPRYLSDSGRLFFDSADALSPRVTAKTRMERVDEQEAEVGVENVYQYEPPGTGSCTGSSVTFSEAAGGCVNLISSGTSSHESDFLDASVSGNDVFILTSAALVPQDLDTADVVYDAHVCEAASPCPQAPSTPPPPCQGEECQGSSPPLPSFAAPESATSSGSGNLVAHGGVLPVKEIVKPKPLTRAQKLAKALKACRKDKQKRKRLGCEKKARKQYGPSKPKAKKSASHRAGVRGVRS